MSTNKKRKVAPPPWIIDGIVNEKVNAILLQRKTEEKEARRQKREAKKRRREERDKQFAAEYKAHLDSPDQRSSRAKFRRQCRQAGITVSYDEYVSNGLRPLDDSDIIEDVDKPLVERVTE